MPRRRALLAAPLLAAAPALAQIPNGQGSMEFSDTPALVSHKVGGAGDNPDLILRRNLRGNGPIDYVLHFHGFSDMDPRLLDLRDVLPGSGLDLVPIPEAQSRLDGRANPTLAVLPRGRPRPRDRLPGPFDWPALAAPGGLNALLNWSIAVWGARAHLMAPPRRKLILTAHSGGGGGLLAALDQAARDGVRVDEVFCYDALYRDPAPLIRWAKTTRDSVLVVIHTPGGRNAENARRVKAEVPWARIHQSVADHADIPRANGWRLLIDVNAALI